MRKHDILDGVAIFVAAAQAGSFSEAGRRLGITPSAVSQAVRGLEERLRAPLFWRSTRSLRLTDAGVAYLQAAQPALAELKQAADLIMGRNARPSGPLRLTMPRAPFEQVIAPMLADFQRAFPAVDIEIAVEARLIDIVKEGYDAGLRFGQHLDKHMAVIRVAPVSTSMLAASPAYLSVHQTPYRLADIVDHRVIMCRSQMTGTLIPWTMECANDIVQITPPRVTVVHDLASQIELAVRGVGIVNAPAAMLNDHLSHKRLLPVLPEWSSPLDAVYLYFPSLRGQSATLRAFCAFLRTRTGDDVALNPGRIHHPPG